MIPSVSLARLLTRADLLAVHRLAYSLRPESWMAARWAAGGAGLLGLLALLGGALAFVAGAGWCG